MFSCSHPFLININKYLDFDRSQKVHCLKFSEVVFHEALHIYLDDNFSKLLDESRPEASPLALKYMDLGGHVTAHLHLYAIQKRVYEINGMSEVWKMICELAKTAHNPGYKIAVDLVNEVGSQAFLNELT